MSVDFKKGVLTIGGWEGLGNSLISGFTYSRAVDNSDEGIARVGYAATKKSGTVFDGLPIQFSVDSTTGNIWAFTTVTSNTVKISTDGGNSWASQNGDSAALSKGGVVWKDFVLAFKNAQIDYNDIGTGWTNNWQTITGSVEHPVYKSVDDKVYFGNGATLGMIQEVDGQTFDPATGATFIFNTNVLDLPTGYEIFSIVDNGDLLLVGATSPDNIGYIFPWDRGSTQYEQPIEIGSGDVKAMKTSNRLTYGFVGNRGQVFVTNGVTSNLYARLPETILGLAGINKQNVTIHREALFIQDNKLFFGASNTGANEPTGLYTLDLNPPKNTPPMFTHVSTLSTGEYGQTNGVEVGALHSVATGIYIMGVRDLNEVNQYFVDRVSDAGGEGRNVASWITEWQTEFIQVGSAADKTTFNYIDIQLINKLSSSGADGVRVSFRANKDDAFTLLPNGTITGSANGAISCYQSGIDLDNLEKVQFKIELAASTSKTPELFFIRFT